jgi:hypothetical protein
MLPNLIVIGAMKCGTTSLHYYLDTHPEISMSKKKELDFFILEKNWPKGAEWYESNFVGRARIYGESSPHYTNYPRFPGVPERMHSVIPDTKLIYLVRDPIERMISDYVHLRSIRRETRGVAEALTDRAENRYLNRSKYFMQLEQYLRYFPPSNIFVITQEELYHRRFETLQMIFRYLGVDDSFFSPRFNLIIHKTADKLQPDWVGFLLDQMSRTRFVHWIPLEMREKIKSSFLLPLSRRIERPLLEEGPRIELRERLKDDVEQLRKFAGRSFQEWSL